MKTGLPCKTAMRVAVWRAAHPLLDEPKVLEDPLAMRIIGTEAVAAHRSRVREIGVRQIIMTEVHEARPPQSILFA